MADFLLKKLRRGDIAVIKSCFFDLGFKQSYFPSFAKELRAKGIHLMSTDGRINTKTKGGDVYLEQLCWYIEHKIDMNRQITLEGVYKAIRQGKKIGRRKAISAENLPQIFTLIEKERIPVAEVAKTFNVSPRTLYRYAKAHRPLPTKLD